MASSCFILAHDNIFNRAVLKDNALYYKDKNEVKNLLDHIHGFADSHRDEFINANLDEIRNNYSWEKLVDEHEKYFKWLLEENKE